LDYSVEKVDRVVIFKQMNVALLIVSRASTTTIR